MEFDRKAFSKAKMLEHWNRALQLEEKRRKEGDPEEIILNAMAMHAFQAVNYAIDLMEEVAEREGLGLPFAYTELPLKLAKGGLISEEEAWELVGLIRLRNKIAHEYHVFSPEDVEKIVRKLKALSALERL